MSLVACASGFEEFEHLYMHYYKLSESLVPHDALDATITSADEQAWHEAPKGKSRDERPQKEKPQGYGLDKEHATEECESQSEHISLARTNRRHEKKPPVPLVPRLEFLRILSETIHGIRVFSVDGLVRSWRAQDVVEGKKFVVVGLSPRKQALTFPSTNHEESLLQLQWYKDNNQIIYPEGNPKKVSTFGRWLAHDLLFMLPRRIKAPGLRKKTDVNYPDGKDTENFAFPGVSLNKKKFSMGKAVTEAKAKATAPKCQHGYSQAQLKLTKDSKVFACREPVTKHKANAPVPKCKHG
jgi:hypothetical protein